MQVVSVWLGCVLIAMIIVLVVRILVADVVTVVGSLMAPHLLTKSLRTPTCTPLHTLTRAIDGPATPAIYSTTGTIRSASQAVCIHPVAPMRAIAIDADVPTIHVPTIRLTPIHIADMATIAATTAMAAAAPTKVPCRAHTRRRRRLRPATATVAATRVARGPRPHHIRCQRADRSPKRFAQRVRRCGGRCGTVVDRKLIVSRVHQVGIGVRISAMRGVPSAERSICMVIYPTRCPHRVHVARVYPTRYMRGRSPIVAIEAALFATVATARALAMVAAMPVSLSISIVAVDAECHSLIVPLHGVTVVIITTQARAAANGTVSRMAL